MPKSPIMPILPIPPIPPITPINPPKKMTSGKEKELKERRTPFLSRGMGRTTHLEESTALLDERTTVLEERASLLEERASLLEERADTLETLAAGHLPVAFVEELPPQPNPDTIYFICSAP